MPKNSITLTRIPFETYYPGVSPQLLARTRQMWSARRLDLDEIWSNTIGRFRGIRAISSWNLETSSGPIDQFFMFDQATIWVASLSATATTAVELEHTGLTTQQWKAIQALTYRMIEQLDAIRLLFISELPMPSMQIARSISEDIDMMLAFISRPKLAARFIECATIEESNEFWRRHIAGGRAFKAVSEQLYKAGLEFDQSGEYAAWRKSVKAILSTAVHTSYQSPRSAETQMSEGRFRETCGCLYFTTLRLQEMCAYSHGLTKDFGEDLNRVHHTPPSDSDNDQGCLTARISEITVDQLRWTLANECSDETLHSH